MEEFAGDDVLLRNQVNEPYEFRVEYRREVRSCVGKSGENVKRMGLMIWYTGQSSYSIGLEV